MKVFATELKRALTAPGFSVAAVGTVIAAFIGGFSHINSLLYSGGTESFGELYLQAMYVAIHSDTLLLVMPVLCALPFAASFAEDFQSRFLRAYLPRAGTRTYLASKTAATALSGGLSLFVGMTIVLLICIAIFPSYGFAEEGVKIYTWGTFFLTSFLVTLGALLWSLVGGMAAAVLRNRYMAYAVPFIIFYVLSSFQPRFYRTAYAFNPQEWIKPAHLEFPIALACSFIALAGACIAYYFVMKRRLRDV